MSWRRIAVVLSIAAVGLAGCGLPKVSSVSVPPLVHQVSDDAFQMAPVISTNVAPCVESPGIVPETVGGLQVVDCLHLGTPFINGPDVQTAALTGSKSALITLTKAGAKKLDLALHGVSPVKRVAILSFGVVVAAPNVITPAAAGQVPLNFSTSEAAQALVSNLGGDLTQAFLPSDADLSVERAMAACDQHRPAGTAGDKITAAFPRTAGDITNQVALILRTGAPPWDTLSVDHFVAECVYNSSTASTATTFPTIPAFNSFGLPSGPAVPAGTPPPVRVCPNGKVVLVGGNHIYLVDEFGNVSPDPLAATNDPKVSSC